MGLTCLPVPERHVRAGIPAPASAKASDEAGEAGMTEGRGERKSLPASNAVLPLSPSAKAAAGQGKGRKEIPRPAATSFIPLR